MASTIAGHGHELVAVSKLLDGEAYREAVGLNNHGVALLHSGDYGSAARLFKQASRKMMSAMHDESSTPPSSEEQAFASASASATSTNNPKVRPYKNWNKNEPESCNLSAMETTAFQIDSSMNCLPSKDTFASGESLVFGRPLLMQMPTVDRMDPLQCTSQSSVLVYNLALAFHVRGSMGGGKGMLETALELYDIAARLVWVSIRACPALVTPVLLVALHNMGRIYHGLGGDQEARECSHQLAIVLRMVRDQDEGAGCDYYERLCLSLLSFTKSMEAAGAA